MEYEWDEKKAKSNLKKHGVDFADAVISLEDENQNEQRFKTLGMGSLINILLVVHAERDVDTIRIISARKADPDEVKQYYKDLSYE